MIPLPNIHKKQMALLRLSSWFPPAAQVRSWLYRADRALFSRQFRCDSGSSMNHDDQRKDFVFRKLCERGWFGTNAVPDNWLEAREAPKV